MHSACFSHQWRHLQFLSWLTAIYSLKCTRHVSFSSGAIYSSYPGSRPYIHSNALGIFLSAVAPSTVLILALGHTFTQMHSAYFSQQWRHLQFLSWLTAIHSLKCTRHISLSSGAIYSSYPGSRPYIHSNALGIFLSAVAPSTVLILALGHTFTQMHSAYFSQQWRHLQFLSWLTAIHSLKCTRHISLSSGAIYSSYPGSRPYIHSNALGIFLSAVAPSTVLILALGHTFTQMHSAYFSQQWRHLQFLSWLSAIHSLKCTRHISLSSGAIYSSYPGSRPYIHSNALGMFLSAVAPSTVLILAHGHTFTQMHSACFSQQWRHLQFLSWLSAIHSLKCTQHISLSSGAIYNSYPGSRPYIHSNALGMFLSAVAPSTVLILAHGHTFTQMHSACFSQQWRHLQFLSWLSAIHSLKCTQHISLSSGAIYSSYPGSRPYIHSNTLGIFLSAVAPSTVHILAHGHTFTQTHAAYISWQWHHLRPKH